MITAYWSKSIDIALIMLYNCSRRLEVKILIYDNVKRLCWEKHTTICTLEKDCGIGNGSIGKWADGDANPRIGTLKKIADYFGITVDELLKDNGE